VLSGDVADGVFVHPCGRVPLGRTDHRGPVKLGFRPEHATMVDPGTAGALAAEVYVVEPLGNETLIALRLGDDLINLRADATVSPAVGSACGVLPATGHLHLFDVETGDAIHRTSPPTEGAEHERAQQT
jgi:multiple sugar transport system ATP-binding protein